MSQRIEPASRRDEDEHDAASAFDGLFATGGEMGALMRTVDWAATPIGVPASWPQSLRTAVSICLHSRFPMLVWWGRELVMLYNDAYRDIIAAKHPGALGAPGRAVFPEIWDVIGPMLGGVLDAGTSTWSPDQLVLLDRHGYVEECYFTFAFSPIYDESGRVGGVFTAVNETTERVLSERRLRALRELAARTADAQSERDAIARALDTLGARVADLPFAALYLLDDGMYLRPAGAAGVPGASLDALGAGVVALGGAEGTGGASPQDAQAGWDLALARAAATNTLVPIRRLPERLLLAGGWEDAPPREALAIPIAQAGQERPYGVLVAGVNARRALDEEYRGFFALVSAQLATALASTRAYEAERHRADALAELDRAKSTFFNNVSHEFRTPLTLLLGSLADALADMDEPLAEGQRGRLLVGQRNALRLLNLVNSLLDFSRLEAGRLRATYESVDLAALTAHLAGAFSSLIQHAGLRFVVECPPLAGLTAPIYVDREQWEKIVLNLISNALKFTFAGEIAVTLRPSAEGDAAILAVRDTGAGIAPEELSHIFERFHRVEGVRARTHEGMGIGLALVRELALLHGGEVGVESAVGVGSNFTVRIPAGTAHLPQEQVRSGDTATTRAPASGGSSPAFFVDEATRWLPAADEATGRASGGQRGAAVGRVMVVDDNADMRDYLTRVLGVRYEVVVTSDGAAALAEVRARPPDLVLTDVMMPWLDGFGLVRELKADPATAHIPVIVLSARAGEEATVEGLDRGADDYLVKPFAARELLARVAARLEVARLRHEALTRARELETIFEAITDATFIYDRDGRIVRMNSAARKLFGLEAVPDYSDRSPQARADFVHASDERGQPIPASESVLYRLLRGETLTGADALDVRLRFADGRELDVSIAGAPLMDATGAITGAIAISRDVTERRQLERRTHEVLQAVLDMADVLAGGATPSAVAAAMGDGAATAALGDGGGLDATQHTVREVLALAQRVLGGQFTAAALVYPETGATRPLGVVGLTSEIERRWWRDLVHQQVGDYLPPAALERLYGEEIVTFDFAEEPPISGQDYFGLTSLLVAPVRVDERRFLFLGVEARDHAIFTPQERDLAQGAARLVALVLERERLLSERAEAQARALALREANRRMDEFLGIASHELRTPLTSVTATVQMSERQVARLAEAARASGDAQGEAISRAHVLLERTNRQLKRLDQLVSDLVDVSRISAGRLEMRVGPADLLDVVREAVEAQRASWPERRILLDLPRGRETLPAQIDADRVGQVVTNFLTNALKYSREAAPVAVRLRLRDGVARAEVRDRGPGLSADQQAHLWERFHRVPGVKLQSGSGVGLGLGLHISHEIIERHGGAVGLESTPGVGSTFWFTLPVGDGARLDASTAGVSS